MIPRILFSIAVFSLCAATPPPYKERLVTKYFFDEDATSLVITDFQFPSAKRGIASGYTQKNKDKPKPVMLVSSDAGERWTFVPLKEIPSSMFFLDDGTGWMVGEKSLWKTEESGRSWRKLSKTPQDIIRVWFISREHGWAVAAQKQVFETVDGGETWTPLAAAALPKVNPDFTNYDVIAFAENKFGIIAGWNNPPRRGELPSWMDPKKAHDRPQWPTTIALLQTVDGGKTWGASTVSLFGHMTKMSMSGTGDSLGLIEFNDNFAYPSEVFLASKNAQGKSERVYREANRFITDVLLSADGTGFVAGVEAVGTVRNSPVPAKVKLLKTTDFKNWTDIPVDYRADAHRVMFASPDAANIWVATDTGMILKLVREP